MIPDAADLGTDVGVHAGFPNAGLTPPGGALSLDQLLIPSPSSTYLFRINGHHWEVQGIFDQDIAVVDRAVIPRQGSMVVSWDEHGELHINRWQARLTPTVWGVITATIHQWSVASPNNIVTGPRQSWGSQHD